MLEKIELTTAERWVMVFMAQGNGRQKTAYLTGMSLSWVNKVLKSVYGKTGAQNSTHAVALLLVYGVLSSKDVLTPQ